MNFKALRRIFLFVRFTRKSRMWVYFKELGNSCLSCKLCGGEIKNMEGHLTQKHPVEYLRLQLRTKLKGRYIKTTKIICVDVRQINHLYFQGKNW